ncbi:unnamed protein product [Rhodiola kirilowii]
MDRRDTSGFISGGGSSSARDKIARRKQGLRATTRSTLLLEKRVHRGNLFASYLHCIESTPLKKASPLRSKEIPYACCGGFRVGGVVNQLGALHISLDKTAMRKQGICATTRSALLSENRVHGGNLFAQHSIESTPLTTASPLRSKEIPSACNGGFGVVNQLGALHSSGENIIRKEADTSTVTS